MVSGLISSPEEKESLPELSWTMVSVSVHLLLWFFSATSSVSLGGQSPAPQCPPQWLLFGHRCFAFFPVWSSWSTASTSCSQSGGNLMSLHTPEEKRIVLQLTNTSIPVWLGPHQNGSWLWSDDALPKNWTNQMDEKSKECQTCMQMTPKSGKLLHTPCGELLFYVCTTSPRFSSISLNSQKLLQPGIVPGVLLFDLMWDSSSVEAEAIFYSSSLLRGLRSGDLTERCYSRFMRQEELYLSRVKSTLQVLISGLREDGRIRSLLLDVFRQYSTRKQSLQPSPPPPQWLQWSLQSFHRVVLEDPVYWLVALSARACLQNFVAQRLHRELGAQPPNLIGNRFYQTWRRENVMFVWVTRFKKVMEEHQGRMDPYKAVNIFREHMMNQKSLHKAVNCEDEEDEETHSWAGVL
ncbi:uncharacterized protein V3H82_013163 [Fundulus diaphanus]